jgi:hypothetical protein
MDEKAINNFMLEIRRDTAPFGEKIVYVTATLRERLEDISYMESDRMHARSFSDRLRELTKYPLDEEDTLVAVDCSIADLRNRGFILFDDLGMTITKKTW